MQSKVADAKVKTIPLIGMGGSSLPQYLHAQPRVAGGRRSEVKEESRAPPGSEDMSSGGLSSSLAR
ncbi:MAG: hypothetical protein HY847_07430 [Betaproteobacteria bacterium]|nr:hypothetical protein [Betaproteobacteria bacterium]